MSRCLLIFIILFFVALTLGATGSAPVLAGALDDASAAYKRGDYKVALELLHPLAENGNVFAQSILGDMYVEGHGVVQDYVQAHMWFNLGAAKGGNEARRRRDALAKKMTTAQIADAQKLARDWKSTALTVKATTQTRKTNQILQILVNKLNGEWKVSKEFTDNSLSECFESDMSNFEIKDGKIVGLLAHIDDIIDITGSIDDKGKTVLEFYSTYVSGKGEGIFTPTHGEGRFELDVYELSGNCYGTWVAKKLTAQ